MAGNHKRNVGPMLTSPRCGAATRQVKPCRGPAVAGRKRCRMHGGAKGTGAPKGNQNALTHGTYSGAALRERAQVRAVIREATDLLQSLNQSEEIDAKHSDEKRSTKSRVPKSR
jgi:hypothetical protein